MKKLILYFFVCSLICLASCQKKPSASFTSDKEVYYAGDTIHLTNTSTNAHSYVWTMPDGSQQFNENASYVVDTSVLYEKLNFQLEAYSKHDRKKSLLSKPLLAVMRPTVTESCIYLGTESCCPLPAVCFFGAPNIIVGEWADLFYIKIDDKLADFNGLYEIKDYGTEIKNYITRVYFSHSIPDNPTNYSYTYTAYSGKMVIYYLNGYKHIIINNAPAINNKTGDIKYISSNLLYQSNN